MFDLVNFNIGGSRFPTKSGNSNSFDLKAETYNSARGPMGAEKKAANTFVNTICSPTFNAEAFAFFIYSEGDQVTHKALKTFEALLKVLAREFDADRMHTNDAINMGVEAKRLLEWSKNFKTGA